MRDLASGQISLVSTGPTARATRQRSPSISADGRWVSFDSKATNFGPGDTGGDIDVYVKDLETGAIDQASVRTGGGQATGTNGCTAVGADSTISADGRFVAFWSDATNAGPQRHQRQTSVRGSVPAPTCSSGTGWPAPPPG